METASGSCCGIIPFQTNRNRVRSIERLPTYAPCSIGEAKWRCKCSNQRQQWLRSSCSGCFFFFATGNHSPCKQSQDLKSLLLLGCSKSVGYAQTFSRDPACLVQLDTYQLAVPVRSSGFVRKLPILPKACWPHVSISSLKMLACILRGRLFFEQTT